MTLGAGLNRARASEADPPSSLTWETEPFKRELDVLGNIELCLDATASAVDTTTDASRRGGAVMITLQRHRMEFRSNV